MEPKAVRKSCDLCYRKRIKCNGERPRCSNCVIYKSDCAHQAASRPKKYAKKAKGRDQQARKRRREALDASEVSFPSGPHAASEPDQLHGNQPQLAVSPGESNTLHLIQGVSATPDSPSLLSDSPFTYAGSGSISSRSYPSSTQKVNSLPEEVVRHVANIYLSTFNSTLPLFHPRRLLKLIDEWYRLPTRRSPSSWACINLILALTQWHCSGFLEPSLQIPTVGQCIENAQSVLTDILKGDNLGLEHVQILLGLGIVFLGRPDPAAPMVFVSAAIRFAQAMGLHRRDYYADLGITAEEAMQRRRVFWIAYILDRDVALRARQAPILHDDDMDLDLPPETMRPDDDYHDVDEAGFIDVSADDGLGLTRFNLFRARVELAQIESRVYDCVFSVRASRRDPGEAAQVAQGIRLSIRQWKARIPGQLMRFPLLLSHSDSMRAEYLPRSLCTLSALVVTCLGQLCRVNSVDFHWIDKVLTYACDIGDGVGDYTGDYNPTPPSQPQGWNALVSESRAFVHMFSSIPLRHPTFTFMQICPLASSLLCLSVNSFLNFDDEHRRGDQVLKADAAAYLQELPEQDICHVVKKVLELDSAQMND
ncbi:hypothetical protein G7054_g9846 [Neopestalotiopsis clavispora]|nr:hypothetical protein G7054_g9846 [Neopestalotiopsis clavispora]